MALAGCLQPDALAGDGAAAADDGAADGVTGGAGGAGTPTTASGGNASGDLGHMPHLHDYWDGRERVTLFDGDVEPTQDEAVMWTLFQAGFERDVAKAGGTTFRFPDGAIVYEGTGRMEVTATWEDPRVSSLELTHRSSESLEYSAPAPLASAETLVIDVTPAMTDMPHMKASRWELVFTPAEAPGAVLGPFRLKVDIVKVRDVMEFPGHPELFFGKSEKVLLDASGRSTQSSYVKRAPNVVTEGEFGEHWIVPTEIVPMETQAMRAEVTLKNAESQVGQVADIRFYYRTANSYQPTAATKVEGSVEAKRLVFELPVEMQNTDSPYATESQWRFLVEAATNVAGEDRTCGGCFDTDIEFHVVVTAYDHALAADA